MEPKAPAYLFNGNLTANNKNRMMKQVRHFTFSPALLLTIRASALFI